jgi:hypothetical protein
MDLQQHRHLREKFLAERQLTKKPDVQGFLEGLAFRYYFMEKTLGIKLTKETKVSKLIAFEKMVLKDKSFTFKE